ncbi:serine hydrolase domain-containing protein [Kaarinaea lacus]
MSDARLEHIKLIMRHCFLMGFLSVYILSCGGCVEAQKPQPPYWPAESWRTSTPEQQGFDSGAFAATLDTIEKRSLPIHSLLVIRHGYLVLEAYFYPYTGKTPHAWASVTKSVTSTLIGLLIDDHHIKGTEQRIVDFFPEYRESLSDVKKQITVENLLTMTSGLECGYKPGELEALAMQRSANFVTAVFELPIHTTPGSEFSYCSGATHLLSAIVNRATKVSALEYAQQRLFKPLRIKDARWPSDPQGINYGWSDLMIHPRDMAKIGYLYLRNGVWDGKQILSADWIRRSTLHQVGVRNGAQSYGYGWWIGTQDLSGMYIAAGRGGQRIVVWPEKDIVVVMNGAGLNPDDLSPMLLSAIKSDRLLPENKSVYERLQEKVTHALNPPQSTQSREISTIAKNISTRIYVLEPNLLDIRSISLNFEEPNEASLILHIANRELSAAVGLDGMYRFTPSKNSAEPTLAVKGYWSSDNEFIIDYTEANGILHFRVVNRFTADKIAMQIDDLTNLIPTQVINGSVDH